MLRALLSIKKAGANPSPAMRLISLSWKNKVLSGFDGGTNPYGTPWEPVLRNGRPLRDTGRLQRGIEADSSRSKAVTGTNVCYAIVHQEGATIRADAGEHLSLCGYQTKNSPWLRFKVNGRWAASRQVKIPQRQIFPDKAGGGLPVRWENDAADIIVAHLRKASRA